MNSLWLQDTLEDDIRQIVFANRNDLSEVLEGSDTISLVL